MTNTVSTNDKYKFNQWQIQFRPMTNTCSTNDKYSFNQSSPKLAVADAAITISVNCSNHLPYFLVRHLKISHKIFWQEIMIKTLLTFWTSEWASEGCSKLHTPSYLSKLQTPSYLSKLQIYLFKLQTIFVNMGFRGLFQIAYNHHSNCILMYLSKSQSRFIKLQTIFVKWAF